MHFCSHGFAPLRVFTAHQAHTSVATILRSKSGSWRVQVRRQGQYASRTFVSQADARAWAREMERRIDLGQSLTTPLTRYVGTLGEMITLHIQDMCDVGRAPLRS